MHRYAVCALAVILLAAVAVQAEGNPKEIPVRKPVLADAGERDAFVVGDLRVSLSEAVVEGRRFYLRFLFENRSQTKIMTFPWTALKIAPVVDQFGNHLGQMQFANVPGSLYPGKSKVISYVYRPPVDRADQLHLETYLTSREGARSAKLQWRIPRSMWADDPKGQPKPQREPPARP